MRCAAGPAGSATSRSLCSLRRCSPSCASTWPPRGLRVGRGTRGAHSRRSAMARRAADGAVWRPSASSAARQRGAGPAHRGLPCPPGLRGSRRPDSADRSRGASAAVGRGLARLPVGRAGPGVVHLAPPPPGRRQTLSLPTARCHPSLITTVVLVVRAVWTLAHRAGKREAFCLCQRALALPAIARDQASTNAQPEGQQATRVGEEWLHPVLIRHTGIHCREQETRDRDSNLA